MRIGLSFWEKPYHLLMLVLMTVWMMLRQELRACATGCKGAEKSCGRSFALGIKCIGSGVQIAGVGMALHAGLRAKVGGAGDHVKKVLKISPTQIDLSRFFFASDFRILAVLSMVCQWPLRRIAAA